MFFIYKVAQAALAFNNQPYLLQSGCLLQRVVANSKELVTDSNKWLGATCGVNICNQVVASMTSHIFFYYWARGGIFLTVICISLCSIAPFILPQHFPIYIFRFQVALVLD